MVFCDGHFPRADGVYTHSLLGFHVQDVAFHWELSVVGSWQLIKMARFTILDVTFCTILDNLPIEVIFHCQMHPMSTREF